MALPCKCLIKCLYHPFEILIGEFIQFAIKRMDRLFEIILGSCVLIIQVAL